MKVVFITNYINHHQIGIADELYKHLGNDYVFIATTEIPQFRVALGYPDYSDRPYLLKAYLDENKAEAQRLADESDVVIIGAAPDLYIKKRLAHNKLTFRYSERWFKKNYNRLLFPPFWLYYYNRHTRYRNSNLYMLCASAYTSSDAAKVFAYPNKCFKWGLVVAFWWGNEFYYFFKNLVDIYTVFSRNSRGVRAVESNYVFNLFCRFVRASRG